MTQAAIAGLAERPRRFDLFGVHSGRIAYWLILPLLLLETAFVFYPIVRGIMVSLQGPAGGIDFSNYAAMLGDPDFLWIMIRTLVFTILIDVIVLFVGLGVALLMNWPFAGRGLVRSLLTVPWAVPEVPVALTFLFMLDPTFGVFNLLARLVPGVTENPQWLLDPVLAMAIIVVVTVWKGFPFYSLVLLAALQSVPEELYEAARIDGAGAWAQFRNVTVPGIRATIALLAILAFIYSMQQFTLIWLITGGGPVDATTTLAPGIYLQAFRFYNFGYAGAMAVIGFLFSGLATFAFVAVQRRLALHEP
jgi:multiple sugar transport system permease protein